MKATIIDLIRGVIIVANRLRHNDDDVQGCYHFSSMGNSLTPSSRMTRLTLVWCDDCEFDSQFDETIASLMCELIQRLWVWCAFDDDSIRFAWWCVSLMWCMTPKKRWMMMMCFAWMMTRVDSHDVWWWCLTRCLTRCLTWVVWHDDHSLTVFLFGLSVVSEFVIVILRFPFSVSIL